METMNKMVEQIAQMVKQISEVMAQNAKLIATLSKDGGDDCPLEAKKTKRPKGWGTKRDNWQGLGSHDNDAALQEWISKNKP